MTRYICELGVNIIAEADTLEELRDQLEWQIDDESINAVSCYDTKEQREIDVYELLGYDYLLCDEW